ncbi:MAG: helix-turn-helix domain-containing protein [Clostridium cochlearium]|uniref:PucR family transcriptional regulator n=2 Tax=Clostridium cochlearium TaxID=1494 RepID=UPI001673156A|nr:helix-turn-helix domain-containing protein [Clostridium cochlearium]MBU5269408.1 helix-turn-helix domain-containing protein [Clostridium cochlearium]MCR1972365.1 helix-turn-helix domain-containing protein [Clostridium cochlearium]MDU1442412.1 helix-turn-helix domain-containing protein [Clostridium cochlearium]
MNSNFYDIYNYFKDISRNIFMNNKPSKIVDTKLITKHQNIFLTDILYVGKTSYLPKEIYKSNYCNLLLINDAHIPIDKLFNTSCNNIIELNGDQDIYEVFNKSKDFLFNNLEIINNSAILLDSILKENSLNKIIEISSKLLDNPLILIDNSFKIIAYSNSYDITDIYWKENIKNGYCSYDFIVAVNKIINLKKASKNHDTFEVICGENPVIKLVCKVTIDEKVTGYLLALSSNKPFSDNDNDTLKLISKIIGMEIKKNNLYNNIDNIAYENLLLDLLEDKILNSKILSDRLKNIKHNLGKYFYVFSFDISNYNLNGKKNNYLSKNITNLFQGKNSIYYKNNIIMLYDFNDINLDINKAKYTWEKFLIKNNIKLAISKSFINLLEFKKYYIQSLKALELGKILKPNYHIVFYEELQFYDLISFINKEINLKEYCHKSLKSLNQYDEINNTNYYHTLFLYLKNNQNSTLTAKDLFIHRNTMLYRINKIKELTNIDFSNTEETFQVLLSYKIMNYINKLDNK